MFSMYVYRLFASCNDPKMKRIMAGVLGGTSVIFAGVGTAALAYTTSKKNAAVSQLNAKVERDLEIDSFNAQSIIFDSTNENFVLRIVGSSSNLPYVAADYKLESQDFYNLKNKKDVVEGIKKSDYKFINNVLDIINRSEFINKEAANAALANGEIVLNLSKPYLNEETGLVNYNLTIAELNNKDLKLGTYIVSAPLDARLSENPEEIYSRTCEEVQIEKVDEQTYKDVMHVEMCDDCTLVM